MSQWRNRLREWKARWPVALLKRKKSELSAKKRITRASAQLFCHAEVRRVAYVNWVPWGIGRSRTLLTTLSWHRGELRCADYSRLGNLMS